MPEGEFHERREDTYDLESAKQHLLDMYARLAPFIKMDEEKNKEARMVIKDLEKVTSTLDIKARFEKMKTLLPELEQRQMSEEDLKVLEDNLATLDRLRKKASGK